MTSAPKKSKIFRVTGLETAQPDVLDTLKATILDNLLEQERSRIQVVTAILPSCYDDEREKVALVEFRGGVPSFLSKLEANPLQDLQVEMGGTDINFDLHFHGFTQLYVPEPGVPIAAE